MKTVAVLAVALALALAGSVSAQEKMCWQPGWVIDADSGTYPLYASHPSYGTWFDTYNHKEYLWVHASTDIDFYELTDKSTFNAGGAPTLSYALNAGSKCIVSESFVIGDDIFSFHGDEPYCTCNWTPTEPCPSQLSITIDGEESLVKLGINSVVSVDTVSPDIEGEVAVALNAGMDEPMLYEACNEITNPEEIAGKWCLTLRGSCYFNTKYLNCMAAGAIGVLVQNRDNGVITMRVTDVQPGDIHIMIGADSGTMIRDALDAGSDVILKAGKGTGPTAPLAEYSSPDPLGMINMFTGKVDLEDSPFILTDEMGLDYKNKVMYAWSVDGNIPEAHIAMNYSEIVDGQFPVIGVFDFGGGPGPNGGGNQYDGSYKTVFYQGDKTYIVVSSGWNRIISIFDVTDSPVDPVKVSDFEMVPGCPEQTSGGSVEMHPSGEYLLIDDIRDTVCGPPPGAPEGAGQHTIRVVDIKDPANPKVVKDVYIPEVESGALIRNGATYAWGPNGLVGFPMTSSGFVLYDFSDPENPFPASEVYDPAENTNDFTRGVFNARYGDDGFWYVFERDGVDGVHGEFHQLKSVPCDMPFACRPYV